MMVYRQFHNGIAYDKREPFTLNFEGIHIHSLVLFTDTDVRMQPPDWDRLEHYRVGVVFSRRVSYTFKLWLQQDGKVVLFNNNATERIDGINERLVNLQSAVGPQDEMFDHVIRGLLKHYRKL